MRPPDNQDGPCDLCGSKPGYRHFYERHALILEECARQVRRDGLQSELQEAWIYDAWELLEKHQYCMSGLDNDPKCPECGRIEAIRDGHKPDCKLKRLIDQVDPKTGDVVEVAK